LCFWWALPSSAFCAAAAPAAFFGASFAAARHFSSAVESCSPLHHGTV
jgi:hypothetical protein